jgi:Neutral/alkaline non-lysosomal ceramidase, N-terminal
MLTHRETLHSRRNWLRRISLAGGSVVAASALELATQGAGLSEKRFRAGAFAVDVTPTRFPISMAGQMRDQVAHAAQDRLHARCLVLDDSLTRVAITVVDSCMIPRELLDEAKKRVHATVSIPIDHILISATHTHTAPAVTGVFQTEPDEDYASFLVQRIAEGIEQAHRNLAPATVGWAVGRDPTQVFCRRWLMKPGTATTNPFGGTTADLAQMHPGYQNPNAIEPTGPADPDVSLLSLRSPDGRPIALLANYGMHYAGFGIAKERVSADYFGRFAERFKQLIGAETLEPAFVAVMSNGPCADVQCYDYSKPRRPVDINSVAESVAQAAILAYKNLEYREWVPLVMRETLLRLPLRLPSSEKVTEAKELLTKAKGRTLEDLGEIYARETVLLSEGPTSVELKLQALRIGGLGIATIPCEVYAKTGLAIKQRSPIQPTFIIELANGYNGYLPPPEQHKLGGYTTWRARSSCLEMGAEPKIRDAVLALLKEAAIAE